jgi:hypothetical protein
MDSQVLSEQCDLAPFMSFEVKSNLKRSAKTCCCSIAFLLFDRVLKSFCKVLQSVDGRILWWLVRDEFKKLQQDILIGITEKGNGKSFGMSFRA